MAACGLLGLAKSKELLLLSPMLRLHRLVQAVVMAERRVDEANSSRVLHSPGSSCFRRGRLPMEGQEFAEVPPRLAAKAGTLLVNVLQLVSNLQHTSSNPHSRGVLDEVPPDRKGAGKSGAGSRG